MKKILRLILVLVLVVLAVKFCSDRFGSVISLPGSSDKESSGESGGWLRPKEKADEKTLDNTISSEDVRELERELGIGTDNNQTTTPKLPTSTTSSTSSSTPLSFKGIPMTGSLSAFGTELVKAGFKKASDGTYTGQFAGYNGCRVTPSGSNPVQQVRVDFPVITDWDTLEKSYDSLQASLTQKYGIEPKTATNSNVAVYNLPNGTITLDADVSDRSSWHVILTYSNGSSITTTTSSGRNPIDDL
ncbi:MAG: hypothetical protein J6Y32_07045 [Bacteroidales bacterium]|nr:hypothetical protein [Bacteroidales bacterium]